MATSTRRGRASAGPRPPSSLSMLAMLALIVIGVGVVLSLLNKKRVGSAHAGAAAAAESKPFADMPPERGPFSDEGRPRDKVTTFEEKPALAPEVRAALLANPAWEAAKSQALEADALYEAAKAAKRDSDVPTLNEKGREAKAKYDQALESTALWEDELMEKLGDRDPDVKRIMDLRSRWMDALRWLHKSTSR